MKQEILELNKLFDSESDRQKALSMAAYMKGLFAFKGIPSEKRRFIQKMWMENLNFKKDSDRMKQLIRELFLQPEREFHYVGLDLLVKIPKKEIVQEDIELIEFLVTTNSWWDTVDGIAANFMGKYFEKFPGEGLSAIERWRKNKNMWLNRTCLLAQLKYRDKTDFELLKSLIIQYQPSKEFFIRKAIGWTLREYSKYNPEAVRIFIDEIKLDGLARREASKYL